MCVPVLKCHQLQGALSPDPPPGALPPGPPLGAPPQTPTPGLAVLRAKPTVVLFSAVGTAHDCVHTATTLLTRYPVMKKCGLKK